MLHLNTGAMMQDVAVEQHSTQNGSALIHPYRDCPVEFQAINQKSKQDNWESYLIPLLPSKWF